MKIIKLIRTYSRYLFLKVIKTAEVSDTTNSKNFNISLPSIDSGRHVPTATKPIKRVVVTTGANMQFTGKAIVAYKRVNKPISMRNINDVIFVQLLTKNIYLTVSVLGIIFHTI